jgi:hypothetical protein
MNALPVSQTDLLGTSKDHRVEHLKDQSLRGALRPFLGIARRSRFSCSAERVT